MKKEAIRLYSSHVVFIKEYSIQHTKYTDLHSRRLHATAFLNCSFVTLQTFFLQSMVLLYIDKTVLPIS